MLGNRHLHGHGHIHAHGLRHLHPEAQLSHANAYRSEFVDGSLSAPIADNHAPTLLAARSGSDEKPVNPNTTNMIIGISVAVPLVAIMCVLFYLHRRNNKRVALEDMDDKYRSLDFGVDEIPGGKKRRSAFFGKEKDPSSHRVQLSMDMNLSSPYLLPPELQHSRESLHSLTRSLHKTEDPYRLVKEYTNSEVGSLHSFQRGPNRGSSSIYTSKTGSSDRSSSRGGRPPPSLPTSRQNSLPTPTSPLPQVPPAAQTPRRQEFEENVSVPLASAKSEFRFTDESPRGVPSLSHSEQVPTIQEPPAAASRISHMAITETVRPMSGESAKIDQSYAAGMVNDRESMSQGGSQSATQALGIKDSTRPPRNESMSAIDASGIQDYQDYSDHFQINEPDHAKPQPTSGQQNGPHPIGANGPAPAGLGVPAPDNRRLSVGLRPLPPDDFLESEDPEFRANRIRSFYKEYFEDTKQETARPPMPTKPVPPQNGYYEDYDQGYLGEAAYFDPETNAFVMPYAAPVTRRAMTPPPSNRRPMPGPRQRGPPGGMPMPGPPGARPRAGSTMSAGRWAQMSPRPGSSASNPRAASKPRKPLAPPTDLTTLPTPSKLKDDSFALLNAMEFAPPPSFRDQAAGRSQSPVGERVPFRANTPVHSPLVSAFEETAPLPSPHVLRKSSTFTGLDFAPPRRFKDPEVMSDAGSIRSNRSGLSSQNAIALRNGAGRVSRLPGDTIFTAADSATTLKPQWGMRP